MVILDRDGTLQGVITRGDVMRAFDNDPSGSMGVLDAGTRKVIVTFLTRCCTKLPPRCCAMTLDVCLSLTVAINSE